MFNYPYQKDQIITPTKALLMGMLCAVWLLTGLIGHDPWKPDEAYSFGLVYHILQSGDWLVPTLAGDVLLDKPPLFYWTAAIFAKLFAPLLPLHDGARLASGLYMLITMLFVGSTGRELFGRSAGWAAVIILIGSTGLLIRAHLLVTDLGLLAGCAMMIYGYALSSRRHLLAGVILGTGVGIGFMSKGFIAPVFFGFIGAALMSFPDWRNKSIYLTQGIALLSMLPWLIIWPALLYLHSPDLFRLWAWDLNLGRMFEHVRTGAFSEVFHYVTLLPWFAWPAFPLAVWAVWEARRKIFKAIEFQLLLATFSVMFVALSLSPSVNDLSALPMLLPLSLLATAALFTLRRGAANALDWFGIMTFALIAILLWWGWTGLLVDSPAHITHLLKEYRPGFEPILQVNQFWIAVFVTVLWMVLVWRVGRSIRRSVINWAAGVTLLWLLVVTLWMPWLDSSKSYRTMVVSIQNALPKNFNCVEGLGVGESQRAMLEYFGHVTVKNQLHTECEFLLVQTNGALANSLSPSVWNKIWEGGRPGDKSEHYFLYQHKNN